MQTIRAYLYKQTFETAYYRILGRKVWIPEQFLNCLSNQQSTSRKYYAKELAVHMKTAHDKLRSQKLQIRAKDKNKKSSFKVR